MGLIDNFPIGKLIVTNLLAFAEFERAIIDERTQAGKAIAKKRPDFREGRQKNIHKYPSLLDFYCPVKREYIINSK